MAVQPATLSAIKWVGTGAQVAGVFMLSTRVAAPPAAFAVMLAGSSAWSLAAWLMREWSVLALNAAFTASNVIGIWRWFAP